MCLLFAVPLIGQSSLNGLCFALMGMQNTEQNSLVFHVKHLKSVQQSMSSRWAGKQGQGSYNNRH